MLDAREARFAIQRPAAEKALQGDAFHELQQRRIRLAETLSHIEREYDPVALAHADEARQWQRLAAIASRLNELPDTDQTVALRERQRLLQGILYWQLFADYKPRLWQMKQQLVELDDLLEQGRHARDTLRQADLGAADDFAGFGHRIMQHKAEIERLRERTAQTRLAQGRQIVQLAIHELEQQQARVEAYLIQARFALAQTYDSALHPAAHGEGVQ
jgi:hypothetical protein